jgi:PAS domain S-box-containing protein
LADPASPGGRERARIFAASRRVSIRVHLFRLVLATAFPLVSLIAWNLYVTGEEDVQGAREQVLHLAQATASDAARLLGHTRDILNVLAPRDAVRALDPAHCDPILKDILALTPHLANVATLAMDGTVICSAVPTTQSVRGNPDRFLKRMRGPDELTVGLAAPGVVTGKWVLPVGRPLLNAHGRVAGAVVLPLDLIRLPLLPSVKGLSPNTVVSLIAGDGTVLARSLDPQKFVGMKLDADRTALREKSGTAEVIGIDGVRWLQGFVPVPGTDWIALASLPAREVFAAANAQIRNSVLFAIVILAVAVLLAMRASRAISSPISAVVEAVNKVAAGDLAACAPVSGPEEIAQVATQFNRMVEARARAEDELRENEGRLSGVIASAMDAIISINEDGEILMFNPAAEKMFGSPRADMIGKQLDVLIPGRLRAAHARHIDEFGTTGVTNRAMGKLGQIVGLRANGEEFPIEASISQLGASPGKLFTVILRDVTERRRTEAALRQSLARQRELSVRLQASEETERRKINSELHDRVGQNLAALNINLNIVRSRIPQQSLSAVSERLDDTQRLLEETAGHIRNVMADLHPPALDEYGLLAALRTYAAALGARLATPVVVHGEDLAPRLPLAAETALFRIAQGALANAIAHANASQIQVTLGATTVCVTLTIADDGIGFDATGVRPGRASWGLAIMRERAEGVGANLSILSAPGRGTRVVVEIAPEVA